jgi:hypothetical protein
LARSVWNTQPTDARESYDQRWVSSMRYCARRVSEYTHRPVVYQVGVYGTFPRYAAVSWAARTA